MKPKIQSRLVKASCSTSSHHAARTRGIASLPDRWFPTPPLDPRRRSASTSSAETDWLSWLRKGSVLAGGGSSGISRKALLLPGLGSYPHTPHQPTAASMQIWERASEAILTPDMTIGYEVRGMEEFAGSLRAGRGIRGWMRGWVEGRTLDELMRRPDVTAAFILTSSIAILASAQELSGSANLLPPGTAYLCGHGFIGTLTALVAAGRLDLDSGVRLARLYASLPPSPPKTSRVHLTTVLSARHFHSLSSPSMFVPFEDPFIEGSQEPAHRKRAMQQILDEIHDLQKGWAGDSNLGGEWAAPGIINSSRVLVVTGTQFAVHQVIERLQLLNLANPVMDVVMPCPYHTRLMDHALPTFSDMLSRCHFVKNPSEDAPIIMDPMSTYQIEEPAKALLPSLTHQLRWHKTLSRLYNEPSPRIDAFLSVGRGAKGLGVMLRGELKKRAEGSPPITIEEFGVKETPKVIRPRPFTVSSS